MFRILLSSVLFPRGGFPLQIPVTFIVLQHDETAALYIYMLAHIHTYHRHNRDARKFRRWRRAFVLSFFRSFVRPSVRASIRPSARWYWPCNWAQTLSSARPAKDYTPACPEGLEPNVLVWYIMLQIPVSDPRGEAGVNGVTFSVVL